MDMVDKNTKLFEYKWLGEHLIPLLSDNSSNSNQPTTYVSPS